MRDQSFIQSVVRWQPWKSCQDSVWIFQNFHIFNGCQYNCCRPKVRLFTSWELKNLEYRRTWHLQQPKRLQLIDNLWNADAKPYINGGVSRAWRAKRRTRTVSTLLYRWRALVRSILKGCKLSGIKRPFSSRNYSMLHSKPLIVPWTLTWSCAECVLLMEKPRCSRYFSFEVGLVCRPWNISMVEIEPDILRQVNIYESNRDHIRVPTCTHSF